MILAEKTKPFTAFIDPDAPDFFNAADMPGAICNFPQKTGQQIPDPNDIGSISRIIYESLALKYRNVLVKNTKSYR